MPKDYCNLLKEAIPDEKKGSQFYIKLAEAFRESDNPGVRAMAILAEKLAYDEEGHHAALIKVSRLACSR